MLYTKEHFLNSSPNTSPGPSPNTTGAKIIDFFDAREKLIAEAQEIDRRQKLDEEISELIKKEKRSLVLADPIEDALVLFLAAAVVVVFILLLFSGSG